MSKTSDAPKLLMWPESLFQTWTHFPLPKVPVAKPEKASAEVRNSAKALTPGAKDARS